MDEASSRNLPPENLDGDEEAHIEPSSSNAGLDMEIEKGNRRGLESDLQHMEAVSMNDSLPEGFNASEKSFPSSPAKPEISGKIFKETVLINIRIMSIISFFAIIGVLARLGLIQLTTYNGSYLGGVIWANFAACFIMGMAVDSSNSWESVLESGRFKHKGSIPLYIGITTGFCGTCSSFSSALLEIFEKSTDLDSEYFHYPNHAYGMMEFLSVTLAQFGISIIGFYMGKHFILGVDEYIPKISPKFYSLLDTFFCLLGYASLIIVIVLCGCISRGSWRIWTFSCIFSPFAAWTRYYVSKILNPKIKNFPLGTFTINIAGTLILAILTLLSRGRSHKNSTTNIVTNFLQCQVITGLANGWCGTLTTISTFVVELHGLETLHSYNYGVTSICIGFCFMILVLGSYSWSVGLIPPVCKI